MSAERPFHKKRIQKMYETMQRIVQETNQVCFIYLNAEGPDYFQSRVIPRYMTRTSQYMEKLNELDMTLTRMQKQVRRVAKAVQLEVHPGDLETETEPDPQYLNDLLLSISEKEMSSTKMLAEAESVYELVQAYHRRLQHKYHGDDNSKVIGYAPLSTMREYHTVITKLCEEIEELERKLAKTDADMFRELTSAASSVILRNHG